MNVIDKIVTEWAYRCKKGYPELTNEEDLRVFESIFGIKIEEGVKVEFDKENTPQRISISTKQLDGEQLEFSPKVTKKEGFTVYYSLVSSINSSNIKAAMDALKNNSELIESNVEVEKLIRWTLPIDNNKYTHIAILESSKNLNKTLGKAFNKIYPSAKIYNIPKISFKNRDAAVDREEYEKAAPSIQKAIDKWVEAGKDEKGPIKLTKTGNIQSKVMQRLKSKYDIGQSSDANRYNKSDTILDIIIKAIQGQANLLIVDDNIHTGTDFRKLFSNIVGVRDKLYDAFMDNVKDIENMLHIPEQQRTKQEAELIKLYYNAVERRNTLIKDPKKFIQGYVLYLLKDDDIKR